MKWILIVIFIINRTPQYGSYFGYDSRGDCEAAAHLLKSQDPEDRNIRVAATFCLPGPETFRQQP